MAMKQFKLLHGETASCGAGICGVVVVLARHGSLFHSVIPPLDIPIPFQDFVVSWR